MRSWPAARSTVVKARLIRCSPTGLPGPERYAISGRRRYRSDGSILMSVTSMGNARRSVDGRRAPPESGSALPQIGQPGPGCVESAWAGVMTVATRGAGTSTGFRRSGLRPPTPRRGTRRESAARQACSRRRAQQMPQRTAVRCSKSSQLASSWLLGRPGAGRTTRATCPGPRGSR